MNLLQRLIRLVGIDKSIAYTTGAQAVGAVGGFVTSMFILWCLTKEEQDYYYTFKSVMALQVFFELGMNTVITQFAAHEMAHLGWQGHRLTGDERYRSRLGSLLSFSTKWYIVFALLLLLTLTLGGGAFFAHFASKYHGVEWQTPWLILCLTTTLHLMLTPLFSFLQGLGKVKEVARYFFWKYLIYTLSVIVSFLLGAKLYALSIGNITYVLTSLGFLLFTPLGKIMAGVARERVTERIAYFKEVFPFQWKIAVSWISGYFIFHFFKPVLMATEAPGVAGQMGITIDVLTAIQALTLSWTNTKVPTYSGLIEQRRYTELDTLFCRTLRQATAVNALLLLAFFLIMAGFSGLGITLRGVNVAERFLPLLPLVLMMIPEYTNQYVSGWAIYLRCHKQEPFMAQSVVMGLSTMLTTLVFGRLYGLMGITVSYFILSVGLALPWGYHIFCTKKRQWHGATADL